MKTKICSRCGIEKPLEEFNNRKLSKNGKALQCKECKKGYYQDNKKRIREGQKRHYQENREYHREKNRNFHEQNPEYQKGRYKNDPEYYQERTREFNEQNPEYQKGHYQENREQICKQIRQQQKTPEGKIVSKKAKAKRKRELGYIPINDPFSGSEGHHLNREVVMNVPKEIHQKGHTVTSCDTMKKLLTLAEVNDNCWNWFFTP